MSQNKQKRLEAGTHLKPHSCNHFDKWLVTFLAKTAMKPHGEGFANLFQCMFSALKYCITGLVLVTTLVGCSGTSNVNAEGYGGRQVAAVYYATEPGYTCTPVGSTQPIDSYKASLQLLENGSIIVTGDECSTKSERGAMSQYQASLDKQVIVYKNIIFDRSDFPLRGNTTNYLRPIAWCKTSNSSLDFVLRGGVSPLRFGVTLVQMEDKTPTAFLSMPVNIKGIRPTFTFTSREEDPIFTSTVTFTPVDGTTNPGTLTLNDAGEVIHYNVDCRVLAFIK